MTLLHHIFLSLCSIVLDYAMRQATQGKEDELGFTLWRKRNRRIPAIC